MAASASPCAGASGARKAVPANFVPQDVQKYANVRNVMLYFRRMWADDEDFRGKWRSFWADKVIDEDEEVQGIPEGSERRLLAEGCLVWRKGLSTADKQEIRLEFHAWRVSWEKSLPSPLP